MNIKCNVNQAAALRAGINAPSSTITLDVDPAQLTERERAILSAVIIDGHDATQIGICTELNDIVGQGYSRQMQYRQGSPIGYEYHRYSNGDPTAPILLTNPSLAGLHDALAQMTAEYETRHAIHAANAAKAAAEKSALDAREAARVAAVRAGVIAGTIQLRGEKTTYYSGSKVVDNYAYAGTAIYDDCLFAADNTRLTMGDDLAPAIAAYHARKEAYQADQAAKEAAAKVAAEAAAVKANQADAKAHADRVARLTPHVLPEEREMFDRGFLALSDIEDRLDQAALDALRDLITPPDYCLTVRYDDYAERKPCSREEFRFLRRIETRLDTPADITLVTTVEDVAAIEVWRQTADGRNLRVLITTKPLDE